MKETRAEKAQRLVDKGRVTILSVQPHHTLATVRDKHQSYQTILFASGRFWCMCGWGSYHSDTAALCAHALALRLAVEKEVGDAEA